MRHLLYPISWVKISTKSCLESVICVGRRVWISRVDWRREKDCKSRASRDKRHAVTRCKDQSWQQWKYNTIEAHLFAFVLRKIEKSLSGECVATLQRWLLCRITWRSYQPQKEYAGALGRDKLFQMKVESFDSISVISMINRYKWNQIERPAQSTVHRDSAWYSMILQSRERSREKQSLLSAALVNVGVVKLRCTTLSTRSLSLRDSRLSRLHRDGIVQLSCWFFFNFNQSNGTINQYINKWKYWRN